ncbi:hypothetical protein CTI12_AA380640 [Artemisia annua]|uniref:non-specific serine/threonine protein kinase n=1 Tax=Artemisia annua TaxID=35608 RepID=A0A2U1MH91_ARTAN|nr:hypothetical protein CTI12_AA380640 [Artemisia annua]
MIKLQNLFIFFFTILPCVTSQSPIGCNRSCPNGEFNQVPYPFGFSSGCEIQLNCTSNGIVLIGEFPIQQFNSDKLIVTLPTKCGRSADTLSHLYGDHYAPMSANAILMENCTEQTTNCMLPVPISQFRMAIANCSIHGYGNTSCYAGDVRTGMFLDYGNLTGLGYPFRRHQAPAYCGYPGFELNCDQQGPPTIEIMNMTYRILSINSTFQILKIVRQDMNESICPKNLVNTTINHELFDYAPSYMNASLLLGCPLSFNVLGIGSIFCGNNGVGPTFLVPGIQGPGICNTSVIVPFPIGFTNTSGFINTTGSEQILQEGFDVMWKVNGKNCTDCMRSGGQCMYDNVTRLTICSSPSGMQLISLSYLWTNP